MPSFCAAVYCSNSSHKVECMENNISFHRFPLQNPKLLRLWLQKIRREGFVPNEYSKLCSAHFEESNFTYQPFTNRRFLKADAVPTKFEFSKVVNKRKRLASEPSEPSEARIRRTVTSIFPDTASSSTVETQVKSDASDDKPKVYVIRCNPQNGVVVKQIEQDGTESVVSSCVESTSEQSDQMSSQSIPCGKRKACENCETAAERRHSEKMQKWDRFLSLMEELVETCKTRNIENLNL